METTWQRVKRVAVNATPSALKTIWWIFRITATVSFVMFLLKYVGILTWIATAVSPVFSLFGLRGEAALAYVSGYFINVYSCVAVISTLDLTAREITILGTMTLAAHAMILECAVQHKTGTSTTYCFILRTLASLTLGIVLNMVLPGKGTFPQSQLSLSEVPVIAISGSFGPMFIQWLLGLLKLAVWMTCLIYLLNLIQRLFYEFGFMDKISKVFRPLLTVFGLPQKTSFLWIVANVVGLSYGSAAMLDEMERCTIDQKDINLLNTHIGISHSNLEDLLLLSASGGCWYTILLARWAMVTILVWGLRLLRKLVPCKL